MYISSAADLLNGSLGSLRYLSGAPHILERGTHDIGEIVTILLALFFVLGTAMVLRRRRQHAVLLISPLPFALGAAVAHQYPLLPRATLYLAPILVLGAAAGIVWVIGAATRPLARSAVTLVAAVVVLAIAAPSLGHVLDPRATQEMRPALSSLARRIQPDDTVYVLYAAQYGMRWYLECGCAGRDVTRARASGTLPLVPAEGGHAQWAPALRSVSPRFLVGTYRGTDPESYATELDKLHGRARVWVVVSNVPASFLSSILAMLDSAGSKLDEYRTDGDEGAAAVYLYDLRGRGAAQVRSSATR